MWSAPPKEDAASDHTEIFSKMSYLTTTKHRFPPHEEENERLDELLHTSQKRDWEIQQLIEALHYSGKSARKFWDLSAQMTLAYAELEKLKGFTFDYPLPKSFPQKLKKVVGDLETSSNEVAEICEALTILSETSHSRHSAKYLRTYRTLQKRSAKATLQSQLATQKSLHFRYEGITAIRKGHKDIRKTFATAVSQPETVNQLPTDPDTPADSNSSKASAADKTSKFRPWIKRHFPRTVSQSPATPTSPPEAQSSEEPQTSSTQEEQSSTDSASPVDGQLLVHPQPPEVAL